MELCLWTIIGIMALIMIGLMVKIHILQKAAKEIGETFTDRLIIDTNTLIDISCRDRHIRKLASSINGQLRKLRTLRHQFQQGDMELKNAITNISHDLRTPLTAICGYLDLLEQEEMTESVKRYVDIIGNRIDMLKQLTEELFQYSVIISAEKTMKKEDVDMNSLLEETLATYYTALKERSITPNIDICNEKVIYNLDRSALTRVFTNLLNNAIKYSDGDLDIRMDRSGRIVFSNTASGLNQIQIGKLFDRFYTVESGRNSTGLGLAIARTLVEQMNGTISAEYNHSRLSICLMFPVHL